MTTNSPSQRPANLDQFQGIRTRQELADLATQMENNPAIGQMILDHSINSQASLEEQLRNAGANGRGIVYAQHLTEIARREQMENQGSLLNRLWGATTAPF